MKRVWQHPEGSDKGKKYWRGLEELADTKEFRQWLEREFPDGAAEMESDGVSRRSFIRLMGASLALSGLGMGGCRRPEGFIVPYTNSPEWIIPGKSLQYATSMPRRRGAMPLLATTFEGRPTRVDGNPLFPESTGATDGIAQASVLDVYDPDRTRNFLLKGAISNLPAFVEALKQIQIGLDKSKGAGVAILTEPSSSPTRERLRSELTAKYPQLKFIAWEPVSLSNELKATEIALGQPLSVLPRYDKADVILTLDNDFCGSDEGGVQAIRGFASRRRVKNPSETMNRLYSVESRFTATGGMADHRLRLPASQQPAFLGLIARELVAAGAGGDLPALAAQSPSFDGFTDLQKRWAREAAIDLTKYGKALVVVGSHQPVAVHVLALAINQALGAVKSTVDLIPPVAETVGSIKELAAEIASGSIKTLFVLGGNPVYNAPAELNWSELQSKVPQVLRLGYHVDESSKGVEWMIPAAHYLESWGDGRTQDGTLVSMQPMILPLFGGISEIELLAALVGKPESLIPAQEPTPADIAKPTVPGQASNRPLPFGCQIVQQTFALSQKLSGAALASAWSKFLHDGFFGGPSTPVVASLKASAASAALKSGVVTPISGDELEVTLYACPKVDDGRYANNGWLQELPEVTSKLTWDNAALISLETAKKLGVSLKNYPGIGEYFSKDDAKKLEQNPTRELDQTKVDVIRIEINGRSVEVPVYIMPGQPDGSIAIALGYGRQSVGRIGDRVGSNAYLIRGLESGSVLTGIKVTVTGKKYELAQTQIHHSMEGRGLVREATLDEYRKDPVFVKKMSIDSHQPPLETLYKPPGIANAPVLNGKHQWAMVIDLSTCVGCTSCVISCQSENNIPIVGKGQVLRGRSMHWMRLDRYYSETPSDPQMAIQPMLCQHCENAPCETVCPVNATVHSEEGLNVMAYNRCIGTRYCANNCPYKVRRFNFFDYNKRKVGSATLGPIDIGNLYLGPLGAKNDDAMVEMQKNPNVTVRMRGVMEKCTFCVQRIEEAKIAAFRIARDSDQTKVAPNSFRTACQESCPAEAIVFGDISNPESHVSKLRAMDRNYGVLTHLNTQPRVTYLARLRNPNPLMPGADKVGLGGDWDAYGHAAGGHGGGHGEGSDTHTNHEAETHH